MSEVFLRWKRKWSLVFISVDHYLLKMRRKVIERYDTTGMRMYQWERISASEWIERRAPLSADFIVFLESKCSRYLSSCKDSKQYLLAYCYCDVHFNNLSRIVIHFIHTVFFRHSRMMQCQFFYCQVLHSEFMCFLFCWLIWWIFIQSTLLTIFRTESCV